MRIGLRSTLFLKTVVIISGVLIVALAADFKDAPKAKAANVSSASAPAKTKTGGELQQSDWFSQASQCPDANYEAAIGVQDNTVTMAFDEGLNCLGEAFLNDCEASWSGSATGSDLVAVTPVDGTCMLAYRTELTEDFFACEPYGLFLEYYEAVGQTLELSQPAFMEMLAENPSALIANIIILHSMTYLNERDYLDATFTTCRWIDL